ncbi:MAG: hypothetical protein MRJ67_06690 [Nitrospirales bacterium]|nr:hypothetical protein [Nitrospirales bacterium]
MPSVGPAAEVLFLREKDPKPLTPSSATSDWSNAGERAGQLARLKQGPPADQSIRPWGRTAGVDQGEGGK